MISIDKRIHTQTSDSEVLHWCTMQPGESQSVRLFGHSRRTGSAVAKLWEATILAVRDAQCVELTVRTSHFGGNGWPWQLIVNTAGTVDSWQVLFVGQEETHIDTMVTIETRSSADSG